MTYQTQDFHLSERPPANALRVNRRADLGSSTAPACYEITGSDGSTRTITLSKGNRTVLETLLRRPIFCASPVRISDSVSILRRDYGVPITKKMYTNDKATDRMRFGVYFLDGQVRRVEGGAA